MKKPNEASHYANITFDQIVTGERIQGIADVTVLNETILKSSAGVEKVGNSLCVFSGTKNQFRLDPTNLNRVKNANVVFVYTQLLDCFFDLVFPEMKEPFVLVSHNSDHLITSKYLRFLDSKKLACWFAQNVDLDHPKLHPVPIGIANSQWNHGNLDELMEVIKKQVRKTRLCYSNFLIKTNPSIRAPIHKSLKKKAFVTTNKRVPYPDYLRELSQHRFCISPNGNGLDCHRTWEALYLGVVPLVQSLQIKQAFPELPIVQMDSYFELTAETFEILDAELHIQTTNLNALRMDYWKTIIRGAVDNGVAQNCVLGRQHA